jgi:hypothetical protein
MALHEHFKAALAAMLLIIAVIIASCGGEPPASGVSTTSHGIVFKNVSTTFGSGTVDTSSTVTNYTSIAIDPDDNYPAIAYYDSSGANLMYAKWDGSDWDDKATVDSSGDVGQYASLA